MTAPVRIQLKRTKGWKMPPNTVKVDRTTRFGNPFRVTEDRSVAESVSAFRIWLTDPECDAGMKMQRDAILLSLDTLRGRDLACWCPIGSPCHADVLLKLANEPDPTYTTPAKDQT